MSANAVILARTELRKAINHLLTARRQTTDPALRESLGRKVEALTEMVFALNTRDLYGINHPEVRT